MIICRGDYGVIAASAVAHQALRTLSGLYFYRSDHARPTTARIRKPAAKAASRDASPDSDSTRAYDPAHIVTMSVLLETSQGDIVIDLLVDYAPKLCEK